jgi:hypothetical protein
MVVRFLPTLPANDTRRSLQQEINTVRVHLVKECIGGSSYSHYSRTALWITRRLHERQRELEVKRELIAEISGLVMNTVMSNNLLNTNPAQKRTDYSSHEDEFGGIYNKWRVKNW